MANCCICGRKIGGWGADKLTLEPGKDCCHMCAPIIRSLDETDDENTFFIQCEKLYKEMDAHATSYEVRKILEDKCNEIIKSKGYTNTRGNINCPICGQLITHMTEICPHCDAILKKAPTREQTELIRIYNNRFEQYLKNPLYEYKIETVMDSAVLGKFDQDKVQHLINNYAINGWRLHSAFTNEVGKNAALGINATINQTILIFERCIKTEEK